MMTPIERDRELSHRALLRYLKGAGFKPADDGTGDSAVQRFTNRKKTTLDFQPDVYRAYTVAARGDSVKFVTNNAHSVMNRLEELFEQQEGKRS
jgi:hypothetical protein